MRYLSESRGWRRARGSRQTARRRSPPHHWPGSGTPQTGQIGLGGGLREGGREGEREGGGGKSEIEVVERKITLNVFSGLAQPNIKDSLSSVKGLAAGLPACMKTGLHEGIFVVDWIQIFCVFKYIFNVSIFFLLFNKRDIQIWDTVG